VKRFWPRGIQRKAVQDNIYTVKLNGNPWNAQALAEAIESRYLLLGILYFFVLFSADSSEIS
jgi:hypothetical protein